MGLHRLGHPGGGPGGPRPDLPDRPAGQARWLEPEEREALEPELKREKALHHAGRHMTLLRGAPAPQGAAAGRRLLLHRDGQLRRRVLPARASWSSGTS